jgi:phage terminase small subunit
LEVQQSNQDFSDLKEAHVVFCREYVLDWNATRAYQLAYPDSGYDAARSSASALLTNPNIKAYIEHLQEDLAKLAGVSALMVINEHKKLAFSNITDLHKGWFTLQEWDDLSEAQKASIASIKRSTRVVKDEEGEPETIETIEVKMHDKHKALEALCKILGWHAPEKHDHSFVEQPLFQTPQKPEGL